MSSAASSETPARSIFGAGMSDEEEEYFFAVDDVMEARQRRFISNGKPAHAVYIVYKFLDMARRRVDICTSHLSRTFDGVLAYAEPRLADAAVGFLRRGGELSIYIQDEPDLRPGEDLSSHPLLAAISDADLGTGAGRVRVYLNELEPKFDYDFIVMDGENVRFEANPEKAEAYVQLRSKKYGATLERAFGVFTESLTPAFSRS